MSAKARLRDRILESLAWRLGISLLLVMSRDMALSTAPEEEAIEFRRLNRGQVLALAANPVFDMRPEWAAEAVELPGGCSAAFRGSEPVGYAWFAFDTAPDSDGLWAHVQPGAAYRYKAFVRPDCRNLGIARNLNRFTDRLCVEHGRTTALSYIAAHNAPSLASTRAIGSRIVGFIAVWRVRGRAFTLHSPGARRAGLRLARGRPP